jgi:DNA-directed RNA polymerase specialized sigma24 family protein
VTAVKEEQILDFESWYSSEHPRLVASLALACGNVDVAAEAADEAFLRALVRWNRVGSMSSPSGWTYRVALNLVRRAIRRANRFSRQEATGIASAPFPGPAGETWLAVAQLAPRQRTAVVLRYIADLTEAEIATTMGVRRGTVASTLSDARAALARTLRCDQEEIAAW